jgi:predicted nucleic acid-binding protein
MGKTSSQAMNEVILIDSDAFIGLLVEKDAHHAYAHEMFERVAKENIQISNYVLLETATWLSGRISQALAKTFLSFIRESEFPVLFVDAPLQAETEALFLAQDVKGTSIVDCANVIIARRFGIRRIFSFDGFYKRCGLSLLAETR